MVIFQFKIQNQVRIVIKFHFFSSFFPFFFFFLIEQITPARFWPFYTPSHFVGTGVVISTGNFGEIKKIKFESAEVLKKENKPLTYADKIVAVKDQKGKFHDFVEGQYNLCHEVSCILTLHPYIINYIGGVEFGYAMTQRVGIVMEYMPTNLRKAIKHDSRLDSLEIKLQISKKIASGMNFLHSLNPSILVSFSLFFFFEINQSNEFFLA